MRAVVTRVNSASVEIAGKMKANINRGFLILLGIAANDTEETAVKLADKICKTRVFEDEKGKMNLDLKTIGGEILIVSQFTLYADLKGRRPSFLNAAKPLVAEPLYERFIQECVEQGFFVQHGEFGADMQVTSVNDGPVTLLFDTVNM